MSLSPDQRFVLDQMRNRGPLLEWQGELVFLRERFMVDHDGQLLDVVTLKTYEYTPEIAALMEPS